MKKATSLLGISWFAVTCMALFTGTIEYSVEGTLLSRQLGYVIAVSPNMKNVLVLTALLFLCLWLLLQRRYQQSNVGWVVPLTVFLCEFLLAFSPTNLVKPIRDIELLSVIQLNPLSISFFLQGVLVLVCLYFSNRKGIVYGGIALSAFVLYFIMMSNQFLPCHASSHAIRISSCVVCSLPAISLVLLIPCQNENTISVQDVNSSKVLLLNGVFTFVEMTMVVSLGYLCMLFAFDPLPIPMNVLRIINAFVCLFLMISPFFLIIIQKKCRKYIPSSPQIAFLWKASICFSLLSYLLIPMTLFRIVCEYRLVYTEMVLFFPLAPWYFFSAIFLLSTTARCRKERYCALIAFLVGAISSFGFVSSDGLLLCIGSVIQYFIGTLGFFLLRMKQLTSTGTNLISLRRPA